jgi:hypothetical protein
MKTIVLLCVVIVSCRSFAQFKPYDPNDPNPSYVDVFNARRFANEERWNAFNAGDISIEAQQHQWNAMKAEQDAHLLEDRMRANEQRLWVEEQQRRRVEEEQRWAEAAEQRWAEAAEQRWAEDAEQRRLAGEFNGVERILTQEECRQQARIAEVKRRNEVQTISRIAASKDVVASYLASGYAKDKVALATAVQAGDRGTTEKVLGRMAAFREANHKSLASWASQGDWGGETVARLAKVASEIINEGYATQPIFVGYGGTGKPVKSVSAQLFLETGLNTVGDVVAGYLEKGFRSDMAELKIAARLADIDGVRAIAQRMGKFVEDNKDGLFRWSRYGALGGAQGVQLQARAQQLQSGAYLDVPLDYGFDPDGKPERQCSARALISGGGMPTAEKKHKEAARQR